MDNGKKSSWLKVDFSRKIKRDITQLSTYSGLGYPKMAVMAMRIGIKTLMNMAPEQLNELANSTIKGE